jgi:hypothetical protein
MRTGDRGILAEYLSAEMLLHAIERLKTDPHTPMMKAFTPHPVEGLAKALDEKPSRLPWAMFIGGVTGGILGYLMQYFAVLADYPINVGGRPLHSWPAFIPATFELTILSAALTGFLGVFISCKLPQPHHPCFEIPEFERASQDRFFLLVQPGPGLAPAIKRILRETSPASITEITGS